MFSVPATNEISRGEWGQRSGRQGRMRTHQAFVGRLYFFSSSEGFKAQYATTNGPLIGSGIVLNSHTELEGMVTRGSVMNKNYER